MKQHYFSMLWAIVMLFWGINQGRAQQVSHTFTVCPLNVDGLPPSLNSDGLGADGSYQIGQYLLGRNIDVVAVSEDFNYHSNLIEPLGDVYNIGTYRGGMGTSINILDMRFPTDGLDLFWKKSIEVLHESWAPWYVTYGNLSNGADENIAKGYRYYVLRLADGVEVDCYIMHMDADTDDQSNAARASQLEQLRRVILSNKSGRPVIVMGDTNCRYTRDDILGLFINPIEADGRYSVTDVWVDLCKGGHYPKLGSDALMVDALGYYQGEIVDKVLYLNPTHGGLQLKAKSIDFDAEYTLGDHKPLVVTFEAVGTTFKPVAEKSFWQPETLTGNGQEVYLYNVGSGFYISNDNQPVAQQINGASMFNLWGASDGYTISNDAGYRVNMDNGVVTDGATTFKSEAGTTAGCYRITYKKRWDGFYNRTRFFNVDMKVGDDDVKYTMAETKGTYNDWLLISPAQKQAYDDYVAEYNLANSLYENPLTPAEMKATLARELATSEVTYSTVTAISTALSQVIAPVTAHFSTLTTEGNGTFNAPYTINDVYILKAQSKLPTEAVWVKGNVMGAVSGGQVSQSNETTLALGDSESAFMRVQLADGALQDIVNVVDNPGNVGKEVSVYGHLGDYFTKGGMNTTLKVAGVSNIHIASREGYTTLYNTCAYEMPSPLTGAIITETNEDVLNYNYKYTSTEIVPNGSALIIKGGEQGEIYPVVNVESTLAPDTDNLLHGSSTTTLTDITPTDGNQVYYYMLSYNKENTNLGFYWGAAQGKAFMNSAGKAYLALNRLQAIQAPESLSLVPGEITTIQAIRATCEQSPVIYTIQGQRINASLNLLTPGLYIVNGKKVFIH